MMHAHSTSGGAAVAARPTPLPVFQVEKAAPPMLPPGGRIPGVSRRAARASRVMPSSSERAFARREKAAAASHAMQPPPPSEDDRAFAPKFDHICVAVADASEMSHFLTHAGGRACEGFLTPVYLSATWEFSNLGELQVIAPVESFQRKRAGLSQAERPTTTQAFWEGNHDKAPAADPAATESVPPASAASIPRSPSAAPPPFPRPRSTFLQRYLRRHGPSIHHVAFLVPNLARARARFQSYGYTVYGFSDRDPLWKEFFLAPRQALGVVIQVAESGAIATDLAWTKSSAMLSQTHLTPVVKRHIARINHAGEARTANANTTTQTQTQQTTNAADSARPVEANQPQLSANGASASSSDVGADATSSEEHSSPSSVASPSHASSTSPHLPPRLALLGIRLRCASEYKARRQWGDMFQASSCTVVVDAQGRRTLCFRWDQAPMYIAVDIEPMPKGWTSETAAAAATTTAKATVSSATSGGSKKETDGAFVSSDPRDGVTIASGLDDRPQWDGPKWIELHAPDDNGASQVHPRAAHTNQGGFGATETTETNVANATPSTTMPASKSKSNAASPASSSRASSRTSRSSKSSSPSAASAPVVAPPVAPVLFSPTFRALPLDPRLMRSSFVTTSSPLPLPRRTTADDEVKIVTVTTEEFRAKL